MTTTCSYDINILLNYTQNISREYLNYFEYKLLSTNSLRKHFQSYLENFSHDIQNFCILILKDKELKGFLTCEYNHFDSEIFGYRVYKISNFIVLEDKLPEVERIIEKIVAGLNSKIEELNIKYIIFSLNLNIPNSQNIYNNLIRKKFYYINTLLTFKMEKEEYGNLNLPKNDPSEVIIRQATKKDVADLYEIALESYRINRFHLDNNLDNDKCNLLHAVSVKNSVLKAYADVIFVAEYNNKVVGYYSGKKFYDKDFNIILGKAIISAVDEKARGKGIFTLLNSHLLKWFHEYTDLAEMGTYLINHPVHRVWIRNGLQIIRGSHQLAWYRK